MAPHQQILGTPSLAKASPPPNTTPSCSAHARGGRHCSSRPLTTRRQRAIQILGQHLLLSRPPCLHDLPPWNFQALLSHQGTQHHVFIAIHKSSRGASSGPPCCGQRGDCTSHLWQGREGVPCGEEARTKMTSGGGTGTIIPLEGCGGLPLGVGDVPDVH